MEIEKKCIQKDFAAKGLPDIELFALWISCQLSLWIQMDSNKLASNLYIHFPFFALNGRVFRKVQ